MSSKKPGNFHESIFLKIFVFSLLFTGILPCHAYVPQAQLFPYLNPSEATQFDFGDDDYTDVSSMSTFQFLGKNYNTAYINGNGIITFGKGSGSYNYRCDPNVTSTPTIAAYMADAFMNFDRNNTKLMYKSKVTKPTLLKAAQKDVDVAFPSLKGKFSLRELLIVTWYNMPCPNDDLLHLRNTFQAVLATNHNFTFLVLYYNRIEWPSGLEDRAPAQAGIFGGSTNLANTYMIPGSCNLSLVNIAGMSNIAQPGKFVFRVDTNIELPQESHCLPILNAPEMEPLQFRPAVVPVMGSIPLLVRGFDLCFNNTVIRVSCTFHERVDPVIVKGFVITGQLAVICPTPAEFYSLGRVRVDLSLQFSQGQVVKSYGFVYVLNTLYSMATNVSADLLNKTTLSLSASWDRLYFNTILQEISQFFRTQVNRNLTEVSSHINITIMELLGSRWRELYVVHNVSNNGNYTFSPSPHVQARLLSDKVGTLPRVVKFTGTVPIEGSDNLLLEFVSRVGETTTVLGQLKTPAYYEKKCQFWHDHEPIPPNDSLPCPHTVEQAVADWRFSCSHTRTSITVFMQNVPSPSGAASRCVYGDSGELVKDQPFESFLFRNSPNGRRTYWSHLRKDVIPFEECCRRNNFSRYGCRKHFFPKGSLHQGYRYEFPVPFRATCTTHVTTMDGANYILKGLGFYWLFKCPSHLGIQVLLERSFDLANNAHNTVIISVVIKSSVGGNSRESVKFQLDATTTHPRKLLMWMDDEPLNFYHDKLFETFEYLQDNFTLYHDGVTVLVNGVTEALFSFSTGVSIKVTVSADLGFLNIVGLMSKRMMRLNVGGLLGNFDGYSGNDFQLLSNASTKQFYNDFVEKWRVAQNESLFVTPPGKNYSTYYTLPPDFHHDSLASGDPYEDSSEKAHQDFNSLMYVSKIVNMSNSKECEPPTNIKNGGYVVESVSLGSIIQLYCADNFSPKVQQASEQKENIMTFVCVETGGVSKSEELSREERAAEALWVSTDYFRPLSNYTIECLPKEKTDGGQLGPSEIVVIITTSVAAVALVIVALIRLIYKLKTQRDTITTLSGLSPVEILEFFEGRRQPSENRDTGIQLENCEHDCTEITQLSGNCAYDRALELEDHAFTLDDAQKLGSGAFGQVCVGKIRQDGNEMKVAVKRSNALVVGQQECLTSLRSLLSEIKVMSYLGKHDSVVALLGANTGNISKGQVYVFLELCSRGSLEKQLRNLRMSESDAANDPYTILVESSQDISPLAKWSLDIARGMEFLASKHVVHADLATRNVLLDEHNHAKICDFGLSRRMMNYQSYVKSHQEPLPWRWMSPESLRCFFFNEKTDVWSFGVTMWEIYTLGDIPYSGMSWTVDFASRLEEDLCLPVPKHQNGPLFGDRCIYPIMKRCWDTDPNKRPKFQQLVEMLTDETDKW